MSTQALQGKIPLVAGQQSYDITFSPNFPALPTGLELSLAMPSDSGEIFSVAAAWNTLSVSGVTVWLSGVPTSASDGGYILWSASGPVPTISSGPSRGIKVVQLCNRIGRRARGGDFTKLSMNEQEDILEAANAALQRLYNALPTYFKEQTQGFVLPAPIAATGIGVQQYGKAVTGITFTDAQFGQSIVLEGDPAWNQIIGEAELLNPYMGPTGTVGATIYGDAIHSDTYPLDRIIGNPQFANQNIFPLANFQMVNVNNGAGSNWLWQQTVGVPQAWWPQVFGNSQGNKPIMVLKFAPAPEQAYSVNVRIGFWPKRLTLADYNANTELPVPDQFIEKALIPMCLQEFMSSPAWEASKNDDNVVTRGETGEVFARNQLGQIGAPQNRVYCPIGY